jgi:hypothetical protein
MEGTFICIRYDVLVMATSSSSLLEASAEERAVPRGRRLSMAVSSGSVA